MAKANDRLILVSGATGHQGGAVVGKLRERGFPVRALTRNPDEEHARALVGHGTEVVRGDLEDPESLTRALDGVYGAFSVQPSAEGAEKEIREGVAFADAAKRSRISHFVYSSVASADRRTGISFFDSKFQIEEHIRGTGLRHTIFRPALFMENWLGMRKPIEEGHLSLPLSPETRLQMIAVEDIGAFVTMAFEKPGHWQGRAVDIAGDELSMSEVAEKFGRAIGREVAYRQAPWEEWERSQGPDMTKMWRWIEEVGTSVDISALRQEYPGLMGLDRWLSLHWTRTRTA